MNVNINNKNLFSQSLLINKFFFQKNFSHKQTGITTLDSGCQYRNNNYYYNKDGVPFLSKEQADRCINGKDWKKIVSVSDKVKSDLAKGGSCGLSYRAGLYTGIATYPVEPESGQGRYARPFRSLEE